MRLAAQILAGLYLFIGWPMVAFIVMMTRPSSKRPGQLLLMLALVLSPAFIALAFYALGWRLLGLPPGYALVPVIGVSLLGATLLGLPRMLLNGMRGLPDEGYHVADGMVYLEGRRIDGADAATFKPLNGNGGPYAHDAQRVYYRFRAIPGADSATFGPLAERDRLTRLGYWRDARRVYVDGHVLEKAEADGFARYADSWYAHDRKHVFYMQDLVAGADPDTFEVLEDNFARDAKHVYMMGEAAFPGIDPRHFRSLGNFVRDDRRLYQVSSRRGHEWGPIEGVDLETFTSLERGYAKDKARVYHTESNSDARTRVIEGADAASFEVTNYDARTRSDARDRHRVYMDGRPVERP